MGRSYQAELKTAFHRYPKESMAKNWTEEDEQFIRDNFLTMTYSDLADRFDVSTKAMESKIRRMGLKKQEFLAEAVEAIDPTPEPPARSAPAEEPVPTPLESIQAMPRRTETAVETTEERKARLSAGRQAAEEEKERRESARSDDRVAAAVKRLEAGMKSLLQGQYAKAAKEFEAILKAPPPDMNMTARARQYLETCKAHLERKPAAPKTTEDLYLHGVMQMNEGDLEGALEAFNTAAKKDPEDDRLAYGLAAVHAQGGKVEAAIEALQRAVEINAANRIFAKNDSDFTPLRVHREFQDIVSPPVEEEAE
jgi:tetratricopeptide (TPR) repeat protein